MPTQNSGSSGVSRWRRAVVCGAAGLALVGVSSSRWTSGSASATDGGPVATVSVLVAAADLPAGSLMADASVTTTLVPVALAGSLVRDPAAVRGRVLLVPLARGELLEFGMTASQPPSRQGRRVIRVSVGPVDIAPDVTVGADVDVVASFASVAPGQGAHVDVVAVARVVAVEPPPEAASTPAAPVAAPALVPPDGGANGQALTVTLECTTADVLHVLWARDNARSLRLLAHPAGDPVPPPAQASA
jgi:SAF domain-containing protein